MSTRIYSKDECREDKTARIALDDRRYRDARICGLLVGRSIQAVALQFRSSYVGSEAALPEGAADYIGSN